ncbi:hypothetical protein PLICRDRAFT_172492 [Plicaturopsis crispa FD-325 SS-3]|nr:hypothetical protein PLICRDRAFT_172492 [Plicaturopsis crispa FD-325 SS-3]
MDSGPATKSTPVDWIAIEPPLRTSHSSAGHYTGETATPPSFDQSRFDIVLRRQRPKTGGLKLTSVPSRFLNLSNDFEFAGWGSVQHGLVLSSTDRVEGQTSLRIKHEKQSLGQLTGTSVSGNDVLGSVFYALPAVFAVAGVYSPLSLLIAPLTLFIWRPIMEELASALPISGAPYTYLLNVSSKSIAMVGAVLLLLDFASTSVVSAGTAASYLGGEVPLPFPSYVFAIMVLVFFTIVSLGGIKESARFAFAVLSFHVLTMAVLIVTSAIAWGRTGNAQLRENWNSGQPSSSAGILHQIFNGVCIGMLGLTGFECTPAYVARIKPGRFPLVLRNLHLPAIFLSSTVSLLVMAMIPMETILGGANVLSALAQVSAGRWLRTWIVIDAVIVLCGGVLTGILSACELLEQLALDRVVPQAFLQVIPKTGSPHITVLSFAAFCAILYASAGASLAIVSKMFSLVWLTVMTLFPLSLLLLKFNRGRLAREHRASLLVVIFALAICAAVFAGNIAVDPTTAGYFAAYFIGVATFFSAGQNKIRLLRWMYWTYDQNPLAHAWRLTRRWGENLIAVMARLRKQPVCILTKTDEINHLFQMILYVSHNEETSCIKIVHFCDDVKGVPSEMEANAKILDEAFPEITIDLITVKGEFTPSNVGALAHRLAVPTSLMFMTCPGPEFAYSMADLGTRIISL